MENIGILDDVNLFGKQWILPLILFAIPYAVIGYDIFLKAVGNIRNGQVFDENFLMMVATVAAFGIQEFSEAVAVMLFYQVGEWFQVYAVGKSRKSISDMMDICPEYANIEKDGVLEQVDPDDVEIDQVIVVKPGERIPLDGVVVEGSSFVDTVALTGESVPRKVCVGGEVVSGCVNGNGTLKVRVTKAFEDSTVSRILELVENASSKKAKVENFITRFARVYTPIVTGLAVLLAVVPTVLLGEPAGMWVERACIFLVISCPCALVISVPLGFFGGIGASSKLGVLVKGSNYLELISEVRTIVFDKTGTLTKGQFKVSEVKPAKNISRESLLEIAALGESCSNHPIASSIREAYGKTLDMNRVTAGEEISGQGIRICVDGVETFLGNEKLMASQDVNVPREISDGAVGSTVVYISQAGEFLGAILIADVIKDGASDAIRSLKSAGVEKCVMLSGDRRAAAEAVASMLGLDEVRSELLPADKVACVEELLARQTSGKLAFVGDGINDAPVLSRVDVGIAMGSMGSDAAIEAADIVIMDDNLGKIPAVIRLARRTMGIVRQNIAFAIGVKILIMVLGAVGIANMWMAVFGDVGVAVLAILNAMRTLRFK
ncbi:MAG: heavy metal translocating P-type ATPase [Fibrobacter sp.]|nr:heavy metal translocating P-type ATPase [Fibrobacter sp.]